MPRLPGRHQYANAAAAIRAVKAAGFVVTEAMMEKAMNPSNGPAALSHTPRSVPKSGSMGASR
ncbi:hypothetical protein AJ87_32865 [Rhizobium yanglingense]|nr:hypothetical protein AJ87_32865 [Rhizobium yanglingense]